MANIDLAEQLLFLALAEPIGLLIRTSSQHSATLAFGNAKARRRKQGDDSLDSLQVRASPLVGGDIILVNRRIQPQGQSPFLSLGAPDAQTS